MNRLELAFGVSVVVTILGLTGFALGLFLLSLSPVPPDWLSPEHLLGMFSVFLGGATALCLFAIALTNSAVEAHTPPVASNGDLERGSTGLVPKSRIPGAGGSPSAARSENKPDHWIEVRTR